MFEEPNLETTGSDSENKDDAPDSLMNTMGLTADRNAFLARLDKIMDEKLKALEIYGKIKTTSPAEYFVCNMLDIN